MKSTAATTTSTASTSSSSTTTTTSSDKRPASKPQPSSSNDRTYAELQTVRSGGKDATQVLRQHQHAASDTQNIPTAAETSSSQNTVEQPNADPDNELLTPNNSSVSKNIFKKCNLENSYWLS